MRYEYLEPMTIGDAVGLLSEHNGKAKILAESAGLFA